MRPRSNAAGQVQSVVVGGIALLVAAVMISQVPSAENQVAAAGIALQTLAGLLAATELWANRASDSFVRWTARQIATNRWGIAGLLDGRFRSFLIATCLYVVCLAAIRIPLDWVPFEVLGWLIAIPLLVVCLVGSVLFVLAMVMYGGAVVLGANEGGAGHTLMGLSKRLAANAWVWPLIGLSFVVGGILQIAAS